MVYRIIRYIDYDEKGDSFSTYECQGKKVYFLFFRIGKWKTLRNNDQKHRLMKYRSLQKAKKEMLDYFLRDVTKKDMCELCNRTRFCHYIDYDFINFRLPID